MQIHSSKVRLCILQRGRLLYSAQAKIAQSQNTENKGLYSADSRGEDSGAKKWHVYPSATTKYNLAFLLL